MSTNGHSTTYDTRVIEEGLVESTIWALTYAPTAPGESLPSGAAADAAAIIESIRLSETPEGSSVLSMQHIEVALQIINVTLEKLWKAMNEEPEVDMPARVDTAARLRATAMGLEAALNEDTITDSPEEDE